jgi:hypothetical protein
VTLYGDDERRRLAGECGTAPFTAKLVDFGLLNARLRRLPNIAA